MSFHYLLSNFAATINGFYFRLKRCWDNCSRVLAPLGVITCVKELKLSVHVDMIVKRKQQQIHHFNPHAAVQSRTQHTQLQWLKLFPRIFAMNFAHLYVHKMFIVVLVWACVCALNTALTTLNLLHFKSCSINAADKKGLLVQNQHHSASSEAFKMLVKTHIQTHTHFRAFQSVYTHLTFHRYSAFIYSPIYIYIPIFIYTIYTYVYYICGNPAPQKIERTLVNV